MIPEPLRTKAIRAGLAACVATAFLTQPAESQAIFHWFSNCCGGGNTTPTYGAAPLYQAAPAYQAASADPCCAPPQVNQTVNYVPQTCYRTQYVNVPVTTYRPVAGRDPCTGCPVTCMRPATTYVQQARLVPYTTYRMVTSNACCGATTTVGYAPAYSAGVSYAPAASCGGCSGAAAPISYAAPAGTTPYYGGTSSSATVSPTDPASGVPTLAPDNRGSRTFSGSGSTQNVEKPIRNLDDSKSKNENPADGETGSDSAKASGAGSILSPRLIQPNDRTTSYPILRAGTRPVSYREANPPADRPSQKDDGWHPSKR